MRATTKESDECYTPWKVTEALLPFVDKTKRWYEATSGISSKIVDCLLTHGYKVEPSLGKDFLSCNEEDIYDGVITNPPFSKKDAFIRKCYELNKPFALLLPVNSFQGKARGRLFMENGISALVLNSRPDFTGGKSPHFGVAWFMGNGFAEQNRVEPCGKLFFTD